MVAVLGRCTLLLCMIFYIIILVINHVTSCRTRYVIVHVSVYVVVCVFVYVAVFFVSCMFVFEVGVCVLNVYLCVCCFVLYW